VRRALLDYAELASVKSYVRLQDCLQWLPDARLFTVETQGSRRYSEPSYEPGDAFLFGPETRGLPADIWSAAAPERRISIPMRPGNRSLNLANAVAVVVYEAWRQNDFRAHPPPG
jgi:tRNA (cytidine/uridine-2'-O-)-methyltransferase